MTVDALIDLLTRISIAGHGHATVKLVTLDKEHGISNAYHPGHRPGIVQIDTDEDDR